MTRHPIPNRSARPHADSLDAFAAEPLSADARKHRDALRLDVNAAVRARGTRRVVARSAAAAALLVVAGALGVVIGQQPRSGTPSPAPGVDQANADTPAATTTIPELLPETTPPLQHEASTPSRSVLVGYVRTDPTVLERFAIRESTSRISTLDDTSLLAELRAAGLDAGLIRTEGRTRLAFHHTASPESPLPAPEGG